MNAASRLRLVSSSPAPLPQPAVPVGSRLFDTGFPIGANAESVQDPHRTLLLAQWKWYWAWRRHWSQAVLDWWHFLNLA